MEIQNGAKPNGFRVILYASVNEGIPVINQILV